MKRAERLYAVVDLLRARSPRPLSATRLANEFGVTTRTIERDVASLQAAGVPIYAEPGRTGGYRITRDFSLPPLHLDAGEAAAAAVGLALLAGSPFAGPARSARRKIDAVLPPAVRERTDRQLAQVYLIDPTTAAPQLLESVSSALADGVAVTLDYRDRDGVASTREVEPLGLLQTPAGWLLLGWCCLRDGVRGFRLDKITRVEISNRPVQRRDPQALTADLARFRTRQAKWDSTRST